MEAGILHLSYPPRGWICVYFVKASSGGSPPRRTRRLRACALSPRRLMRQCAPGPCAGTGVPSVRGQSRKERNEVMAKHMTIASPRHGCSGGVNLTIQCSNPSGKSRSPIRKAFVRRFHPMTAFACAPPADEPRRMISRRASSPVAEASSPFSTRRADSTRLRMSIAVGRPPGPRSGS